jgi:hypothetical protein
VTSACNMTVVARIRLPARLHCSLSRIETRNNRRAVAIRIVRDGMGERLATTMFGSSHVSLMLISDWAGAHILAYGLC